MIRESDMTATKVNRLLWVWILVLCTAFAHNALCSGTFYQKISNGDDSNEITTNTQNFFTKAFHACSLEQRCNYLAISSDGKREFRAENLQDLDKAGEKVTIWKKTKIHDAATKQPNGPKLYSSCKEAMKTGQKSGKIWLSADGSPVLVYCDMVTDGGGWVVFQRRVNSSVNFERNWAEYERGFGDVLGNFWIGLKPLHSLTLNGSFTLRIDLKHTEGDRGYAKYTNFKITSKEDKYKLMYSKYSGNVGDGLSQRSKGRNFSTYDQDNDQAYSRNCAQYNKGGWWYGDCYKAVLNNQYPGSAPIANDAPEPGSKFMSWLPWKWDLGTIVFSEMKFKEDD